ncbi:MAG: hypothetical protein IJQ02_07995 [Oscillospiraceae bacterium]|nr:hypothetical protein [Oscillospiraceae bacterium]MBR0392841.1 hypothetical protein [Oscillospiraceae bacterium]
MLNSLTLLRAMNGIHEEDVVMAEKNYFINKRNKNIRRTIHITLLAAVLVSLLTVGAYALDFFGSKAIVIPETETETGEVLVSITQPQSVPEEMESKVNVKVENARAAWAEWRNWRETSPDIPHMPQVFTPPEGSTIVNYEDNEDGSCTVSYYDEDAFALIYDQETGEPDFSAASPIEVRTVTAEEMAERERWMEYANLSYGDYDFNYDIHNELEAKKLEEIAAKYGLRLRRKQTLLWSKETTEKMDAEWNAQYGTDLRTDTSDPRFLTDRELCDRVSAVGCSGDLFREIPWGFDKVYYFDEGTFCVSFYQELADGRRVHCYGYNSMYATLSSGREVVSRITDPESFQTRTHTAPDGTELTIMQKGNEAFLYVYLEDSFFEMHIQSDEALADPDVDAVADTLNYCNIGKQM